MRWSPFFSLCLMGGLAIFSSTMSKSPVLPLFAQALGANESHIGLIAAASTAVGIAVSLPTGMLSDAYGRRRMLLAAAVVFATAPFLYLLVSEPWQLVAVRVYHGFATAMFGPVALAYVADLFSNQRGERMGWYSSATMLGRAAAPFLGGAILSLGATAGLTTYRWVYLLCGIAGVVALLLALRLPDTAAGKGERKSLLSGARLVMSSPPLVATSAMEAVQYVSYGAMETFLPIYALAHGVAQWQIGVVLGLQVITTTIAKPFLGELSDRFNRITPIVAGHLIGALALLCLTGGASLFFLIPASLLMGLGVATVTSSTAALVSELATEGHRGAALGFMSTVMDVGHASGPVITGVLVTVVGYQISFALITSVVIVAALTYAGYMRTKNHITITVSLP